MDQDYNDCLTAKTIEDLEMIAEQLEIAQIIMQATIQKWRNKRLGKDELDIQLIFSYDL